jgi:hypothetical protein
MFNVFNSEQKRDLVAFDKPLFGVVISKQMPPRAGELWSGTRLKVSAFQ